MSGMACRQYLDLHDLEKFKQSGAYNRTVNLPDVAWNPWMDLKKREDIKKLDIEFPFGQMPSRYANYIRHHYYAGVHLMYLPVAFFFLSFVFSSTRLTMYSF